MEDPGSRLHNTNGMNIKIFLHNNRVFHVFVALLTMFCGRKYSRSVASERIIKGFF